MNWKVIWNILLAVMRLRTTFIIKKYSMVSQMKINNFNGNIFNKNHYSAKAKPGKWVMLTYEISFIGFSSRTVWPLLKGVAV